MSKVPQTSDELKTHLIDCIGFLNASCASFDAGFLGEAKRLATTIRVLVHDTTASKSLLTLLGAKSTTMFSTTACIDRPGNLAGHLGLVGFRLGSSGASYWAPLDEGPPSLYKRPPCAFDEWWGEHVINDKKGGVFSRRDLTLALANKDGGAHVDEKLDPSYASLTRGNSLGWQTSDGQGRERALGNVELHSVRQIAYEVLHTFRVNGLGA